LLQGKSSLINAIAGCDFLPTGGETMNMKQTNMTTKLPLSINFHCDPAITESNFECEFDIKNGKNILRTAEDVQSMISAITKEKVGDANQIGKFEIVMHVTSNGAPHGLQIFDLPGLISNQGNEVLYKSIEECVDKYANDSKTKDNTFIVAVVRPTEDFVNASGLLKAMNMDREQKRTVFVVTKADSLLVKQSGTFVALMNNEGQSNTL
jgi:Dynamin family